MVIALNLQVINIIATIIDCGGHVIPSFYVKTGYSSYA
jgi:hypothetical protein